MSEEQEEWCEGVDEWGGPVPVVVAVELRLEMGASTGLEERGP